MTKLPDKATILDQAIPTAEWKTYYGDIRDYLAQEVGGSTPEILSISDGQIIPTKAEFKVDTQENEGRDDLTNIVTTNLSDSQIIFVYANNDEHIVTLKHNSIGDGSILTLDSKDIELSSEFPIILQRNGLGWKQLDIAGYNRATDVDLTEGSDYKSPTINQLLPYMTTKALTAIGVIVYAVRKVEGTELCDSTEYSGNTFPDVWTMLTDGRLPSTTYSDYNSKVSSNGFCEKFALDKSNKKFKCPMLTSIKLGNTTYSPYISLYNVATSKSLIQLQNILDDCLAVQVAINNTYNNTVTFVNQAKIDINNTISQAKTDLQTQLGTSLTEISDAQATAEASIASKLNSALSDIQDKKDDAISAADEKLANIITTGNNQVAAVTAEGEKQIALATAQAQIATTKASEASTSEANAKASEAKASTSETNAKASEIAAASSEANAKESETNAKASETAAASSETNAKASETAAASSETNAKASETAAAESLEGCQEIEARIGTVFNLKGRVDTVEDLPSSGNSIGDMWLVGLPDDIDKLEYVWIDDEGTPSWEKLGSTTNLYPASEETAGVIEIATQSEVEAGTDDTTAVSPLKLKTFNNRNLQLTGAQTASGVKTFNDKIYAPNQLDFTNITNVVYKIPQDIKLELSGGTLTLKSGSKAYRGAGDIINITNDISTTGGSASSAKFVFVGNNQNLYVTSNVYSGTTEPSGTLYTGDMWYDTTNKVVKRYNGSSWDGSYSVPICVCTTSGTGVTTINRIFNGFGFIGSCLFALPGVKLLMPNGRNSDGSLNNLEYTISKFTISEETPGNNDYFLGFTSGGGFKRNQVFSGFYVSDSFISTTSQWCLLFNTTDNFYYSTGDYGATWNKYTLLAQIGTFTGNNGKISRLNIRQPFRAANEQETAKVDADNVFTRNNTFKTSILSQPAGMSIPNLIGYDTAGNKVGDMLIGASSNGSSYSILRINNSNGSLGAQIGFRRSSTGEIASELTKRPALTADDSQVPTTSWCRDALVDLTSSQTISGRKTFNGSGIGIIKSGSAIDIQNPNVDLSNTDGSVSGTTEIHFIDKNGIIQGIVEHQNRTSGDSVMILTARNHANTKWTSMECGFDANDTIFTHAPHPSSSSNKDDIATTYWVNTNVKASGSSNYVKIPVQGRTPLIIQWGITSANSQAVTFPLSFSNANYIGFSTTYRNSGAGTGTGFITSKTTTGMNIIIDFGDGGNWVAIGF